RLKNSSFFKDLTPKLELFIVASSTGEWLLVALFFLMIGWLLDVRINLLLVLPMYVVAQLLGVISMLPGAIGSFDVIMLMELSMLGVDRSTALVWLVFFRVFYYLVPLAFGALLFIYHFCQKINRFFKGLPNLIWHHSAHVLITVFMYFSGILMLIDASLPDLT
ncbi:lysylphosphatidylglycerol synthase domain-containing protein, partial [Faecalibacillus intestinalis]|nr:lysylphosphatidylglycerol synthase domain-containing protein [Faecalibacillus intestinalis]